MRRYSELDGLRGLAALTVVSAHLANVHMSVTAGVPIASQARIAVWVFFVLSSFLLTDQAIEAGSRADEWFGWSGKYLLRRFFRIYPLFIFCIIVDVITQRVPPALGIDFLTLRAPCCGRIFWSIPPEFKYYFFIPIIGLAAARWPRATIASMVTVWAASLLFGRHYDFYAFAGTFCMGSAAAILLARSPDVAARLSKAWPLAIVAAVLCSGPLVKLTGRSIVPWDWNDAHGLLWAAVVLACATGSRWLSWLATPALRFLGAISFALYLTHPWVIALAVHFGLGDSLWTGFLVLPATILFAWIIYKAIEEPGRKLGRRLETFRDLRAIRQA
jgi:peptidoglycan/LPS O-acetylase OafA/YrhL